MKQRILSIFLTLMLCLSLFPVTALAAESDYSEITENNTMNITYSSLQGGTDFHYLRDTNIDKVNVNLPSSPSADTPKTTIRLHVQNQNPEELTITLQGYVGIDYNVDFIVYTENASKMKCNLVLENVSVLGEITLSTNTDCNIKYQGTVKTGKISSGYVTDRTVTVEPYNTADESDKLIMTGSFTAGNAETSLTLKGNIILENSIKSDNEIKTLTIRDADITVPDFQNSKEPALQAKEIKITNSTITNIYSISSYDVSNEVKAGSSITVSNSTIEFAADLGTSAKNTALLGDSEKITITGSTINGREAGTGGGIGGAFHNLTIENSIVDIITTGSSAAIGPYTYACYFFGSSPIWADDNSKAVITIKGNSNINAVSEYGAAIGLPSPNRFSLSDYGVPLDIKIEGNSVVNAVSGYGAGIGSGYNSQYPGFDIKTDVNISGSADVTAVSRYGAGIGPGSNLRNSQSGIAIGMVTSPEDQWTSEADGSGSAEMTANSLSAAVLSSVLSPMRTQADSVNGFAQNTGTLTIKDNATVKAESGVKAIGIDVIGTTEPVMEYTLKNDNDVPSVATPINRKTTAGSTDSGPGSPGYDLRPAFRSLAFWPVSAGTYTLSYGSGDDPDPLLDADNNNASQYEVSTTEGALNSFSVIRQQKLGGSVTLSASPTGNAASGVVTSDITLQAVLTNLTPAGIQNSDVTYQWYRDGEAIESATSAGYMTTSEDLGHVIYCAVTGTGLYRGTVLSQAVTVAAAPASVPERPTVTDESTQITADSITLDEYSDYEYGLVTTSGVRWQSCPVFNNLERNTGYSFVQRIAAADGADPGETSAAASFTTLMGKPVKSDLTIDYTDEDFRVPTGIGVYADSACTQRITSGKLSITPYIGKNVYLKYESADTNDNTVTTVEIASRPGAPALNAGSIAAGEDSITLPGEESVVYAIFYDDDTDSPSKTITCTENGERIIFDGLSDSTAYTIRARKPATETRFHSLQAKIQITTRSPGSTIAVTPGNNVYPYDGNGHAFDFTVWQEGISAEEFKIEYHTYGDFGAVSGSPTEIGKYVVTVIHEKTDVYAAYQNTFYLEITRGQGSGTAVDSVYEGNTSQREVAINIDTDIYGAATGYQIGDLSQGDRGKLNTDPTIQNGKLLYTLAAGTAGGSSITIPVIVSTAKYDVTVTVTITVQKRQPAAVSVTQANGEYGEFSTELPDPVITVGGQTPSSNYTVQYVGRGNTQYSLSTEKPTLPGDYTVIVTYQDETSYGTNRADFLIAKGSRTISVSGTADSPIQVTLNTATVTPSGKGGDITYACSKTQNPPTDDDAWQTSSTFSGLSENTTYYFFARVGEAECYAAAVSEAHKITTPAKSVSSISIGSQPLKLKYVSGDTLDLSGLSVKISYNDNSTQTVAWGTEAWTTAGPAASLNNVSVGADTTTTLMSSQHDNKAVKITCGDKTAETRALTVGKGNQAALTISGLPEKVYSGDNFTLTASGGTGNGKVTWSVVTDEAAAGQATVTTDANGSGVVQVTGNGPIKIRATKDADGDYNEVYDVITFTAYTRLNITTTSLGDAAVGTEYKADLLANVTDNAIVTWKLAEGSTLPDGLSLNGTTGEISGTPTTVEENHSFTVVAAANGESDTASLSITVKKGSATPKEGSLTVMNHWEGSYTFDLSDLLPTLQDGFSFGDVNYALDNVSLDSAYYTADATGTAGGASVNGSTLTLPVESVDTEVTGSIGTIKVKISSDNYEDMTATIKVTAENKTQVTITGVTAQDGTYETGKTHAGYTGTISSGAYTGDYTILYEGRNTDYGRTTVAPTDAGDYTVTIAIPDTVKEYQGNTSMDFTISKADVNLSLTAQPTFMNGGGSVTLTLTGLPAGETAGVSCSEKNISVTAGEDNTWTAVLPDGEKSYTFTATYSESSNYNGATATVGVEVGKKAVTVEVEQSDGTYGTELAAPTVTVKNGSVVLDENDGEKTIKYAGRGSTTYDESETKPTDAGTYTVTVNYSSNAYYGTGTAEFEIHKANPTISNIEAVADGPTQVTVSATVSPNPETTGLTVKYAKSDTETAPTEESAWQESNIFTGLTANTTYFFFVRVNGNDNYNTVTSDGYQLKTPAKSVSGIAISNQPANLSYTSGDALNLNGLSVTISYNDNSTETVDWGSEEWTEAGLIISLANGTALVSSQHDGKKITISCGEVTAETEALAVGKRNQAALTISGLPEKVYSGDSFTLAVSGGSGRGAVTWEVISGNATVKIDDEGNAKVQVTGTGEIVIRAAKAGDADYNAAYDEITFTAGSRSSGGGTTSYTVVVKDTEHGTVTVKPDSPSRGQTVTITADPDDGYETGAVTVTDQSAGGVAVTDNGDGTYSFVQPGSNVTVEVIFQEKDVVDIIGNVSDCLRDGTCPMHDFSDLNLSSWYHDGVHYCLQNGLMVGTETAMFSPESTTTRAQIVTLLWRLEGEPSADRSSFNDVTAGSYYEAAVGWAAASDIVKGVSATSFAPNDPITREQFAAILYRYAQHKGYDASVGEDGEDMNLSGYADASELSGYAVSAMKWACGKGLVNGTDGNRLDPKGTATRAQAAAMIQRFCELNAAN